MSVWDKGYQTEIRRHYPLPIKTDKPLVLILQDHAYLTTVLLWVKLIKADAPSTPFEILATMPNALEVISLALPPGLQSQAKLADPIPNEPPLMAYLTQSQTVVVGKPTEDAWDEVLALLGH